MYEADRYGGQHREASVPSSQIDRKRIAARAPISRHGKERKRGEISVEVVPAHRIEKSLDSGEVEAEEGLLEIAVSLSAISNRGGCCRSGKRISERDDNTDPPTDIGATIVPLVNVGCQIPLDDDRS